MFRKTAEYPIKRLSCCVHLINIRYLLSTIRPNNDGRKVPVCTVYRTKVRESIVVRKSRYSSNVFKYTNNRRKRRSVAKEKCL